MGGAKEKFACKCWTVVRNDTLDTGRVSGGEPSLLAARLVSSKCFRPFRRVLPAAPGLPRLSCWHPGETANRGQHSAPARAQRQHRAERRRAGPPPDSPHQERSLHTHTHTITTPAQECLIGTPEGKDGRASATRAAKRRQSARISLVPPEPPRHTPAALRRTPTVALVPSHGSSAPSGGGSSIPLGLGACSGTRRLSDGTIYR